MENKVFVKDLLKLLDYDTIKDLIVMEALNAEEHKEELKALPHKLVGDIAIIYKIIVKSEETGIYCFPINNVMMNEVFCVDANKLHHDALISSPNILKSELTSMKDMMYRISGDKKFMDDERLTGMTIVSNEQHSNGVAVLFYPNVLKDLANQFDSDLYIIPSSIDECIVLCDTNYIDGNHLEVMLHEVNDIEKAVPEGKKLSNYIYHYDRQKDEIETNDDYQKRKNIEKMS